MIERLDVIRWRRELPGGLVAVFTLAGYVWLVAFLQFLLYELFHLPLAALVLGLPILAGWVLTAFLVNVLLGTLAAMGSAWEAWASGFQHAIGHTLPAQAIALFTVVSAGFAQLPNDTLGQYLFATTPGAARATCILLGFSLVGIVSTALVAVIPPSVWRVPAIGLTVVAGFVAAVWAWRSADALLSAARLRLGDAGAFWMLFGIYATLSVSLVFSLRRWWTLVRALTRPT